MWFPLNWSCILCTIVVYCNVQVVYSVKFPIAKSCTVLYTYFIQLLNKTSVNIPWICKLCVVPTNAMINNLKETIDQVLDNEKRNTMLWWNWMSESLNSMESQCPRFKSQFQQWIRFRLVSLQTLLKTKYLKFCIVKTTY